VICVLDASVVLALLVPTDSHHQLAQAEVRRRRADRADLVLPASVLAEVLVGVYRTDPGRGAARRGQLLAAFRLRVLDADVADAAARLRAQHPSLRLPDALVLATAEVEDGEALTADRRWAGWSPRAVVL
jgi:predicted nucleic acid-binding protein